MSISREEDDIRNMRSDIGYIKQDIGRIQSDIDTIKICVSDVKVINESLKSYSEQIATVSKFQDKYNSNLTKIVLALIVIVGANVVSQFAPHSPINWMNGFEYLTRYIMVFMYIFVAGTIIVYRKNKYLKWLGLAFAVMAVAYAVTVFFITILPIIIVLRLIYCPLLLIFALKIKKEKE